VVANKGLIVFT